MGVVKEIIERYLAICDWCGTSEGRDGIFLLPSDVTKEALKYHWAETTEGKLLCEDCIAVLREWDDTQK